MAAGDSQKFIGRNRPPRVQIEYDVEVYGSEKKVQLPFVVGVMADLSGKPAEPLPAVEERKFLEVDIDNFDERMKAIKPRVAFQVPNTLTGEGNMAVEMSFDKMDDFSPAAVAKNVEPLNKLLTARQQLANLIAYMDGKSGAEDVLQKLLADPALLQAVANTPRPAEEEKPAGGAQ
jgi:type VI secretion system protein ImpB